jgi:hypothetical protein
MAPKLEVRVGVASDVPLTWPELGTMNPKGTISLFDIHFLYGFCNAYSD